MRKMEKIQVKEYVGCINKWLVLYGSPELQKQEEKFIAEDLQKIVDEHSSCMELKQLRTLVAIEAGRMGCMVQLGIQLVNYLPIALDHSRMVVLGMLN